MVEGQEGGGAIQDPACVTYVCLPICSLFSGTVEVELGGVEGCEQRHFRGCRLLARRVE